MPAHDPRYYVRMFMEGRWYVLMSLKYSRVNRRMQPTWRKESSVTGEKPYLFKTLVSARMGMDRYVSELALLKEVKVWKADDANVQATGD